ncbi:MAG: hypothetical protein Q4A78_04170 [Peptostreptococcaceae bacterium]|nr:hypothetical protein [Peptostreptococcaceae bacterium]
MKKKNRGLALVLLLLLLAVSACGKEPVSKEAKAPQEAKRIFLYGESHGEEVILEKEAELWKEHYESGEMRHLFMELPYFTAELLNLWMQEEGEEILEGIYADLEGTAAHIPAYKEFFRQIKADCPETVFHGTDIGHQEVTGRRYLTYLEEKGEKDSEKYRLTQENLEQGRYYYAHHDEVYREDKMAENFIRALDALGEEKIMGIYGSAHTNPDGKDRTGKTASMAKQLKAHYGDVLQTEDISWMKGEREPEKKEEIRLLGKVYQASYFGEQELGVKGYRSRAFWRLEEAYEDLRDRPKTGDVLPYNNYPMKVERGQVFLIEYLREDGSAEKKYYRSEGDLWEGQPATMEFETE